MADHDPMNVTDAELIARVRGGERAAFDPLIERYLPRIHGYVRSRVAVSADAQEITQDVFVEAYLAIERFRSDGDFAAWCCGIARNVIRQDARERAARGQVSLLETCLEIEDQRGVQSVVPEKLERCLQKLDRASSELLELFYHEALTLRELAATTGRSVSWCGVELHRVRQRLRVCLEAGKQ